MYLTEWILSFLCFLVKWIQQTSAELCIMCSFDFCSKHMKEAAEELLCCSNGKTDRSISGGQTVPFRVGRCMAGVSRWSNVIFMPSIIGKVVCVTFPDPPVMFVERVCLPL